MKKFVFPLIVFLLPVMCYAQGVKKIPAAVSYSGNHEMGRAFAFAAKEAILASQSFRLVNDDRVAPSMVVVLSAIDAIKGTSGMSAAVAVAIVYDGPDIPAGGIFLNLNIHICGSKVMEACAKGILPDMDYAVEILRKGWPSLWRTL